MTQAETFLSVEGLVKAFDGEVAVNGVTFGVEPGKILTLLGPSGCGKTTTLRCIAGLETPSAGCIRIAGQAVTSVEQGVHLAPERRNIGMVFQSYAVWPHMTVGENLELPLQVRHVPAAERRQRIRQALDLVGLTGLERRYANRLSGGQQQRVALARAIIYNPSLLLFDEPLSNLDAKLRERMRYEIRKLQREVGITSVYVTHDQAEAMIISDRIIVMNRGRVEQEGDARTLYTRPSSAFVATFLGVANLMRGTTLPPRSAAGRVQVVLTDESGGGHTLLQVQPVPDGRVPNGDVWVSVRPEHVAMHRTRPLEAPNVLPGRIEVGNYLGNLVDYVVRALGREWRVQAHPQQLFETGSDVFLELPPESCLCLPVEGTPDSAWTEDADELAAVPAAAGLQRDPPHNR